MSDMIDMSNVVDGVKSTVDAGLKVKEGFEDSFEMVTKFMSDPTDIINDIDTNANNLLNSISGFFKGCVHAPAMAGNCYVYFVRGVRDGFNYVGGFLATECAKILENLQEDVHTGKMNFKYMIIVPRDLPKYGIPHVASGIALYKKYGGNDINKLRQVVIDDPKHTYLGTDKDVELLGLRLKILGAGRVFKLEEVEKMINSYIELSSVGTLDKTALKYQCIIDLAVSVTK